jgi:hypothetical protein
MIVSMLQAEEFDAMQTDTANAQRLAAFCRHRRMRTKSLTVLKQVGEGRKPADESSQRWLMSRGYLDHQGLTLKGRALLSEAWMAGL